MKCLWKYSNLLAISLLLWCGGCDRNVLMEDYAIIPEPVYMVQKAQSFTLSPSTKLCFEHLGQNGATAQYIVASLREMRIHPAFLGTPDKDCITFSLNDSVNSEIGDEGYVLTVRTEGIRINANSEAGLFYGFQTFLQMLPDDIHQQRYRHIVMPECTIIDYPRFAWRGSHLDVARHFFTVKEVKKHLDLMSAYKLNKFHWHLTDDQGWRIEMENYPQLNDIGSWRVPRSLSEWDNPCPPREGERPTYGGYYTKSEIADIVEYAAQRQIEVIPEIELPGHSSAILAAYPELACDDYPYAVAIGSYWPPKAILCAGNDKVLEFLYGVLDEVVALFPSEYIHIGGDDALKDNWKRCPRCQARIRQLGLADEEALQGWLMSKVEQHLVERDRRIIGWDEMMDCGMPSSRAIVMAWRGDDVAVRSARLGNDVIMTPTDFCYFDFCQSDQRYQPCAFQRELTMTQVYRFDPIPRGLGQVEQKHILGGQCNLWTEHIDSYNHAEYMLLPRLCAMAECLWTPLGRKDWHRFQSKIEHHKTRLRTNDYNCCDGCFRPTARVRKDSEDQVTVTLIPEVLHTCIYYTTDGSMPSVNSPLYTNPLHLAVGSRLRVMSLYEGKMQEGIYEYAL